MPRENITDFKYIYRLLYKPSNINNNIEHDVFLALCVITY